MSNALIIHDDSIISRVAADLERYKKDIELFRRILSDKKVPAEYRHVNKEQVRQRLESTQWALADLIEDIEEGMFDKEWTIVNKVDK